MGDRADSLRQRLRTGFLIGDGGIGRMLHARGLPAGEAGELWNVTRPEEVSAVHRAFIEAGSQLVQTNSFQGSRISLARAGLEERVRELNLAAARLAREAAGEKVFVAGSIGPSGEILEPVGDLPLAEARAAFEEQAAALTEGGVDGLIVETFFDLEEAKVAVEAARATGLPVLASMAFGRGGKTVFGVEAGRAAEELSALGVEVVGANCGDVSPGEMVSVLRAMRKATSLPLLAQPNAGRPELREGETVYLEKPEAMAAAAEEFRALGAGLIGGCCGTRPEHIAAISRRLHTEEGELRG
jgi:5-methyltetrahydrofolate--homocysteine methyltransferase